jgi:hypothetical protein
MKTGFILTVVLVVFFAPWGLVVAMAYWALYWAQRYRSRVEESGENFENQNSQGLPFTSRW